LKRLSLLPLAAVAAFAQTKPAPAAPAAPVAPATTYSAPSTAAAGNEKEAPLAPVAASLLQGNAAAPVTIDDVLLVPHSSAGQKAVGFEWANASSTQAYILWDKYFAAAQATGGTAATDAQTLASFGYMTPGFGAGLSLAYNENRTESVDNKRTNTYYNLSQVKLFGSYLLGANDLYGNLTWAKTPNNTVWQDDPAVPTMPKTTQRYDYVGLNLGLRHGPAAGQEGLGWNLAGTGGYNYSRSATVGDEGGYSWLFAAFGQVGYSFVVDGINFLPGADAYWVHRNAKANYDYNNVFAIRPTAAISVPVFEHWTLRGGAAYDIQATLGDATQGDKSSFNDYTTITNTTGNVGLRYSRDRWAVEAQVENSFLASGPYIISGQAPSGNFLARLGFTVNLK